MARRNHPRGLRLIPVHHAEASTLVIPAEPAGAWSGEREPESSNQCCSTYSPRPPRST